MGVIWSGFLQQQRRGRWRGGAAEGEEGGEETRASTHCHRKSTACTGRHTWTKTAVKKPGKQGSDLRELRLSRKEMENLIFERFLWTFGEIWMIFGEVKGIFGNFELC